MRHFRNLQQFNFYLNVSWSSLSELVPTKQRLSDFPMEHDVRLSFQPEDNNQKSKHLMVGLELNKIHSENNVTFNLFQYWFTLLSNTSFIKIKQRFSRQIFLKTSQGDQQIDEPSDQRKHYQGKLNARFRWIARSSKVNPGAHREGWLTFPHLYIPVPTLVTSGSGSPMAQLYLLV